MKTILGLDLGTNSIGWALIKQDFDKQEGKILGLGSRIIPMSQDVLGDFGKGNSISQTAERTGYRSVRRLRQRHLLRRERLHRVLNILHFLPEHYAGQIDFEKRLGQFKSNTEPKIAFNAQGEFLFKDSFNDMLKEFESINPSFLINKNGERGLLPYDWTIYYLRKKALTHKISREELAWIILNFNQKRGYFQLRGDDEEELQNKKVELHSLKIIDVIADNEVNKKGEVWYSLVLENGWVYRRSSKISLNDWKDKTRDFIVTTDLNEDGSEKLDKEGNVKRSFRAPSPEDWTLLKKKTEKDLDNYNSTVGAFIYDSLLINPKQKIKGQLIKTIERKYYKAELLQILNKQKEFHAELRDEMLLNSCVKELYRYNFDHQQILMSKHIIHLLIEDIIFYQRPLRGQKNLISNCSLEFRKKVNEDGSEILFPIKVIAKSNPYYQEFRLLQWLNNLQIYTVDDELNVTSNLIKTVEEKYDLLTWLKSKKEIKQDQLIKFLLEKKGFKAKSLNQEVAKYRWNYVQDKVYPMYETRYIIQSRLAKLSKLSEIFLNAESEYRLWHLIYSVNDKEEFKKGLIKFATHYNINIEEFVEAFSNVPIFKSDYGSYSEKAIKKLLHLMRFGSDWSFENFDLNSKQKIEHILTGEYAENIKDRVREFIVKSGIDCISDFNDLPLWLAQYIVYDRHSEAAIAEKWNTIDDLNAYLSEFKQHSLRNPIVEQIITETLRVVKDIWNKYGDGVKNYFDEIHVELGRELKNTSEERKRLTQVVTENENTNLRIKALLAELALDGNIVNVRPYSPIQQELLKIYEEGVLNSVEDITEEILKISRNPQPTTSDLRKYKLWLEQKYKSPYTGQIIPLNKLFTPAYEIEHIIPQSRYFDDSLSNKIICESAVNKLKDNQLAYSFIKKHHGEIIPVGNSKSVKILELQDYEDFVKYHYKKNYTKRNKLLLEEIPEKMIERQINDTRYISKYVSQLLSNIVRDDSNGSNDDGINSKNVLPGNGKITTKLKQDWGLNDVWNDLILPRFERLNEITGSANYTSLNTNNKTIPTVPINESKSFSKKRIDHRHHAMDALVIACATRDHINLINNESAKSEGRRFDLQKKLRSKEAYIDKDGNERMAFKNFIKPWATFTEDTKYNLKNIISSFKQNIRVINKASNYYESYKDDNGNVRIGPNGKAIKGVLKQKGMNWAVRKPLHKDTVSGLIHLKHVKVAKGKLLTATRKSLDTSFDEKSILTITDTGIQKILLKYLIEKNNNPELAFSAEGIDELNQNISKYNNGKAHQPIIKVRVFEQGSKFRIGETGNKKKKYVEAAKGTNLFFAVYQNENGTRSFETIPLNVVIEREKQGLNSVPEVDVKGNQLIFTLSPNDLVCIPFEMNLDGVFSENIFKVVSFTGSALYVIPVNSAISIINQFEFGQLNKIQLVKENKERLYKITVNRLGDIINRII